jgi:hypothetical protein
MGTIRSRANMKTTKNSVFTTNGTGSITGSNSSSVLDDLIDSVVFPEDFGTSSIQSIKVAIPTAEVLALNSSPKTLIAAPGAGRIIEMIACHYYLDYNSIAYATNTQLRIAYNAIGNVLDAGFGIADYTSDFFVRSNLSDMTAFTSAVRVNTPIIAYVASGNPTAGNSDIYIYITYRIIPL